jgi:hypothetical protein
MNAHFIYSSLLCHLLRCLWSDSPMILSELGDKGLGQI